MEAWLHVARARPRDWLAGRDLTATVPRPELNSARGAPIKPHMHEQTEETPRPELEIAQAAVNLSRQAIGSLITRSGNHETILREALDALYRTRALASQDRAAENLALAMLQAAGAELRATRPSERRP